jgi:uncharacterized protein (DUF58 family)
MRRLELTVAGRWYLMLTILLGVVALISANNIIYLIESLLLSGLILSGVLSEKTVAAVDVSIVRKSAFALSPCDDEILVTNRSKLPLFCVEIGEYRKGEFLPIAFIPLIPPKSKRAVRSQQKFEKRGVYSWENIAVATYYPFEFARKIRLIENQGRRLIWPSLLNEKSADQSVGSQGAQKQLGIPELIEGEVRPHSPEEDSRHIVWPLSQKGLGHFVRVKRPEGKAREEVFDADQEAGPEFERKISRTTTFFSSTHDFTHSDRIDRLTLIKQGKQQVVYGRVAILDSLATVEPQGKASEKGAA